MSHFHRITPLPVRHVKTSMQCVLYPVPVSSRLPRKILNEIFFLNLGEISENDVSKFNRYWMLFWFMGGVVAKTKTPTCISNDLKPGLNGVSRRRKLKLGSWVPVEPSLRGRPYKSRSPSSRARFFPSPSPSTPVTQATLSQVLRALTFTLSCLALTCALPWNEIVYPVQGNLPVWPPNTKTRRGRPFYFLFFAGTRSSFSFNLF